MKTKKSAPATVIVIAAVLLLALGVAVPAFSKANRFTLRAATSTPTQAAGDVIPLKSIDGLDSLNATVRIDANGLINGKRTQGDLTAELATSDQGSRITVTGPLLGDITAQVGGSLVGLFTPSSVDIYKVPQGNYIVVNSLSPVCIKPSSPKAAEAFDQLSPQTLLGMFTNSDVARGRLADKMTVNGASVNHYAINGETFLAAAQKSSDEKLKAFGDALWKADDADLYVDGEYVGPVGTFTPYGEPLTLWPGVHRIAIVRDGFRTMEWEVAVQPGRVVPYRGMLAR
jgi:hypothetical protein